MASSGRRLSVLAGQWDVNEPLPATAVLAVHTEGEEAFSSMRRTYPAGFVDVDADFWKELAGEDD